MTSVVIGILDRSLTAELRTHLADLDGIDVLATAESGSELSGTVGRSHPDVVFLADSLVTGPVSELVKDLAFRSPATGVVVINTAGSTSVALEAMEAGAKGVLSYPLDGQDVVARFKAAREWAERMRGLIANATPEARSESGRHARVTLVAGAKGGVGTTTIAAHMALDLKRNIASARVCLIDLDLQAGDVSGILEARQRVSIADVAKVAQDLSSAVILDALVQHESGISLLLAPLQIHQTELVTAQAVRAIVGLLREEFDVIIIDGGSQVSPAQAAAVEVADEVATVVTPDVLAMRAFRRQIQSWESLGVRSEQEVHVITNRVSREDVLTHDSMKSLTSARVVSTRLPAMFRRLERGVNARNPNEVREATWWRSLQQIGAEVGVYTNAAPAAQSALPESSGGRTRPQRRKRRKDDSGQIALETVALVPLVVLISLLAWQLALAALAFNWNSNAANAAARAYSIGDDPTLAALEATPDSMDDQVKVQILEATNRVKVTINMPVMCPGCASFNTISQTVDVVKEP